MIDPRLTSMAPMFKAGTDRRARAADLEDAARRAPEAFDMTTVEDEIEADMRRFARASIIGLVLFAAACVAYFVFG